ncbi:MAG: MFS transporter [Chloroflexota bacterium]
MTQSSDTTTEVSQPIGYLELVRGNRDFRLLWFGEIVSLLGDWFNLIGSATLVANLTGSGLAVGLLFVVRMLAPFLISPIAGVITDRYNKKAILIWTDIGRAVAVAGLLLVRDANDLWLLYLLIALQMGLTGFFFPARNAILPDIVDPEALGTANALGATTWSTMLTLGAALGGLVAGTLGIYAAFAIDAVTFLVSALILIQINYQTIPALATADQHLKAAFQQYVDGLRYLRQNRHIFVVTLHKGILTLIIGASFEVVQVKITEEVFTIGEGGSLSLGLMFAVFGFGTAASPLLARIFTGDRAYAMSVAIAVGYLTAGVGMAIIAPLFSFPAVLFGTLLRGLGDAVIWVFSTQLLLQLTSAHVRGRVFAMDFAFWTLTGAVGSALAGLALDSPLGITGSVWLMSGLSLIPAILWAWWLLKFFRADQSSEPS